MREGMREGRSGERGGEGLTSSNKERINWQQAGEGTFGVLNRTVADETGSCNEQEEYGRRD